MPYEKADAIAIRSSDYSETSRILVFYTREFGRLSALAKGAKRKGSKVIGQTDLLSHCEIVFASRGKAGLHILTEANASEPFLAIRTELPRYYAACHAAELIHTMTAEADANPQLFDRFLGLLRTLDRGIEPAIVLFAFEAHLLVLTGFMPELLSCVSCGAKNRAKTVAFSQRLGGIICPQCSPRESGLIQGIPSGALGLVDRLAHGKLTKLERVRVSLQVTRQIRAFLNQYESYIVGRQLCTAVHL
jgi:DNA repair protein RecO (recombination protein O)